MTENPYSVIYHARADECGHESYGKACKSCRDKWDEEEWEQEEIELGKQIRAYYDFMKNTLKANREQFALNSSVSGASYHGHMNFLTILQYEFHYEIAQSMMDDMNMNDDVTSPFYVITHQKKKSVAAIASLALMSMTGNETQRSEASMRLYAHGTFLNWQAFQKVPPAL